MHIIFSNTNLDEKLYKKVTYKRGEVVFNSGDIMKLDLLKKVYFQLKLTHIQVMNTKSVH